MNKYIKFVNCPECNGLGCIYVDDHYSNKYSFSSNYKQCTRCCGFGSILLEDDSFYD